MEKICTTGTCPHISPSLPRSGLSLEPTENICSVGNTVCIPLLGKFSCELNGLRQRHVNW